MTPAEFALQLEGPDELLARILAFADRIDEWLDPGLAKRLGELFATRDPEDGARALRACVSLYADVARDVATALALPHLDLAARIDAHISRVLAH